MPRDFHVCRRLISLLDRAHTARVSPQHAMDVEVCFFMWAILVPLAAGLVALWRWLAPPRWHAKGKVRT